jgi:hypothetical protein
MLPTIRDSAHSRRVVAKALGALRFFRPACAANRRAKGDPIGQSVFERSGTGSREENATNKKLEPPALIQSKPERL